MLMQGIAGRYGPSEWAWRAIAAGADMVPVCHEPAKQQAALEGLRRAVGDGVLDVEKVGASLARIAAFKQRFMQGTRERPPLSVIGCLEHQYVAAQLTKVWNG